MKPWIIIPILFQTLFVFGQTPYQGSYMARRNFSAFYLTLKNDSLFDAKISGCKSWSEGAGRFTITKKELTLIFTDSIIPYKISFTKTAGEQTDSVNFQITIEDRETHEPLAAGVYCSRGRNGFRPLITDEKGKAMVRLKRTADEFIFHVDYGGMYYPMNIPITAEESTDISIYLERKYMLHSGKGTVWNYKIIRHNRRRLILKDEYSKWKLKKVKDHVDRS